MACWVTAGLLLHEVPQARGEPVLDESAYARSGSSMFLRVFSPRSAKEAGELSGDRISHRSRHHDTPRLRNAFETSGNVDCCPEQVAALIDHISEMDANADLEVCALSCGLDSSCWSAIAQLTASTALPNSARTLSPAVLAIRPRCCFDLVLRGLSDGSECSESPSLVRLHEPGVANDIRRHMAARRRSGLALWSVIGCQTAQEVRRHPTGR